MKTLNLLNYGFDQWVPGEGSSQADIASAIDGSLVARTGSGGLDFGGMLRHAREVGGPALRKLTFHERARIIKGLGLAIMARKEELYELNYQTGATRKDGWIDIEGGAGTLFSFSSKGRRELPDAHVLLDGRGRAAVEERQLHRPAYLHAAAGRGGAHQRLQLPGVGDARKAGADAARGHAGDRQAGQLDRLSVRSRSPGDDRYRPASARRAAADRRRRRRPVRPSDRPGRRQLHRLGLDRAQAPVPSGRAARKRQVRRRAGQPQRLAARPRRRARHAGVRPVRQGGGQRDDRQGGAEVHRHPPRHGAGRASRRGRGGDPRAARGHEGRRPARQGQPDGRAWSPPASATTCAPRSAS